MRRNSSGVTGASAGQQRDDAHGPPEPPPIFIGSATTQKPFSGSCSRFATFSSPATFAPFAIWCTTKVLRRPVVDAGRVDAERADLALFTSSSAASLP
jgi:hypothetical protein